MPRVEWIPSTGVEAGAAVREGRDHLDIVQLELDLGLAPGGGVGVECHVVHQDVKHRVGRATNWLDGGLVTEPKGGRCYLRLT